MVRAYGPLDYQGLPPASGAWREGDEPGLRQFVDLGEFTTQSGFTFPNVRVAYQTWGTLQPGGQNAVY
ncbi:MAG: hypothetical protein KGN78_14170, partial [Actinomycetales bacterium]|nr:hypothetical protein [Actinomycetales bacterium]